MKLLSSLQSHCEVWRSELKFGSPAMTPRETATSAILRELAVGITDVRMSCNCVQGMKNLPQLCWHLVILHLNVETFHLSMARHGTQKSYASALLLTFTPYSSFSAEESGKFVSSFLVSAAEGRHSRRRILEWMLSANILNHTLYTSSLKHIFSPFLPKYYMFREMSKYREKIFTIWLARGPVVEVFEKQFGDSQNLNGTYTS